MSFNLSLLSKYRSELMGVATLLIILCHMPAHSVVMPAFIASVLIYGGLGCDIFLFLSGMGMWYSLNKGEMNNIDGAFSWIKKRSIRVWVPYLLFAIPCFAIYAIKDDWSVGEYLWRLSTLSFWTDGWGLWFVSLILLLYLITPLLDRILRGDFKWVMLVMLVLLSWILGSISGLSGIAEHIRFVVCRVPCYFIGFAMAENIRANKQIILWKLLLPLVLLFGISLLLRFIVGVNLSLFWIEGFLLLICMTEVLWALKNSMFILKVLRFMGDICLESYCTNVFALCFFAYIPWVIGGINFNPGNWTYYMTGTLCCVFLSVFINRVSKKIISKFRKSQ